MKLGTSLPAAPPQAALLFALLFAVFFAAPTSAQAESGLVRVPVTLQAGPDIGFPAVDRIPRGAEVFVHGCLSDSSWCDVSFGPERGWIEADTLEYFYDGRYVYLPDYIYRIDVPIVTFGFSAYWGRYYYGRPWFHRYAYWNRYWRAHPPQVATQAPPPQGAVAGRTGGTMPATAAVAGQPQQTQVAPAQAAGMRPQGMMAAPTQAAVVPRGGTVGLAAMPHATQPGMAGGGGSFTAMHAQMGGMAHAPVAAMSHAAPAGGGGRGMQFGGGGHGGSEHRH